MEFSVLLQFADVMNQFYLILLIFKRENPTCMILLFEKIIVGLYWDIYRLIFCQSCITIGTTKLWMLTSVWMTMTFIQSHSCVRYQKLLCPFSRKFWSWFWWNSVQCHTLFIKICAFYFYYYFFIFYFFAQGELKGENCADVVYEIYIW